MKQARNMAHHINSGTHNDTMKKKEQGKKVVEKRSIDNHKPDAKGDVL